MTTRYQDRLALNTHPTRALRPGGGGAGRKPRLLAAAVAAVGIGLLLHDPVQGRPADDQVLVWGDGRAPRLVSAAFEQTPEPLAGGHVLVWGDGGPPRLVAQ